LGAYSLVHHGQWFFWEKFTKRKHFLFKGIFCSKFPILKSNSSINGHKLVVWGKCSHTHTHNYWLHLLRGFWKCIPRTILYGNSLHPTYIRIFF
jgi:hypothetical protein